jgi:hypothetical protein
MTRAYHSGKLRFPGRSELCKTQQGFQQVKDDLYSNIWVVSVRESIKRPEYVLEYLGRYTHRVAISNHRIVSLKDAMVTFKYKNRKTNQMEKMTIKAVEFIRRFLLHALPKNFVRIRHYGFLANRNRTKNLEKIRRLNAMPESQQAVAKSVEEMMLKLTGIDITICPCCKKGKMRIVAEIPMYTGICANEIIRPPN